MAISAEFELPLLDASLLLSENPLKRREFADKFQDSLAKHGFARIINHGIPDALVNELLSWSSRFFSLPLDVKSQIEHKPGPYPQRGWSSVGSENTGKLFQALDKSLGEVTSSDFKEHFDVGALTDSAFPSKWLDEQQLPGFRLFMRDFYERCRTTSRQLLGALELSLDLPAGAITRKCELPADELRLNRYPPITQLETSGDATRAWPHTDLGVLTLLFQDSIGGLEIQDRGNQGRFQPISPGRRSELVVNISETLERWTNGKLPAGVHRVTLPPEVSAAFARGDQVSVPDRYSIPYFVKADRNASVGPLPQFVDASTPSAYPDMTGLEYHMKRIAEAY